MCALQTYWHTVVFNVVSGYGIRRVLGDFTSVVLQACGKWPAHRALNTLFAISWDMCDRLLYILIVTREQGHFGDDHGWPFFETAGDSPRILSRAWLTIYRNYFKEVWQSMRFLSLCPRRFYYTTFANGVTWQSVGFPPTPSLRMQLGTGGMSLSHPFHLIADSHTGFDVLFWPACIGRYWDLEIDTQTFNGNHIRSFLQKEWFHVSPCWHAWESGRRISKNPASSLWGRHLQLVLPGRSGKAGRMSSKPFGPLGFEQPLQRHYTLASCWISCFLRHQNFCFPEG